MRRGRVPPVPEPATLPTTGNLRTEILSIAERRGRDKTSCPSEAARSIGADAWRGPMPAARRIAFGPADGGVVQGTQHGGPGERGARGPVRSRGWTPPPAASAAGPAPRVPAPAAPQALLEVLRRGVTEGGLWVRSRRRGATAARAPGGGAR
ncbi:DUF3253 domain-containing protein [Arthrobacter sp. RIT-PI-e]|uniref:DUF3253 domain-containing protein n=1 Tax=Arthrobacter sp. RIT-PI-e TaxID=1681197 RepID=UPI003FA43B28